MIKKQEDQALSQRQLRVGELIKRSLSETLIKKQINDDFSVTISEVKMTPDLKLAIIFFFPLGLNIDLNQAIQKLNDYSYILKANLSRQIKLKFLPDLIFKVDNSFDQVQKIDNLLKKVNEQPT